MKPKAIGGGTTHSATTLAAVVRVGRSLYSGTLLMSIPQLTLTIPVELPFNNLVFHGTDGQVMPPHHLETNRPNARVDLQLV
jgi:hypothetical protein